MTSWGEIEEMQHTYDNRWLFKKWGGLPPGNKYRLRLRLIKQLHQARMIRVDHTSLANDEAATTTQRWLRIRAQPRGFIRRDNESWLFPIRAIDCDNYEDCLHVAAGANLNSRKHARNLRWRCHVSCECYCVNSSTAYRHNYWRGSRRKVVEILNNG